MAPDLIDLVKRSPDGRTLQIDGRLSIMNACVRWYHRRVARDGTKATWKIDTRLFRSEAKARAHMQAVLAEKLAEGFEAPAPAAPSKPRPAAKASAPRWSGKLPAAERARLRVAIAAAKLGHRQAELESLARPAISLALRASKAPATVTTRFGGAPDLPAGFAWPSNEGTPLAFVAQYRLDELARLDLEQLLPRRGVISVFAHLGDGDDQDQHVRAFHFADARRLARTRPPHPASADRRPARTALAVASVVLTLPPSGHRRVRALRLTDDELDRYTEALQTKLRRRRAHQLLGWPDAFSPLARGDKQLVAQIDSDGAFGFEVGDVETLRVFAPTGALAGGDLSRARGSIVVD